MHASSANTTPSRGRAFVWCILAYLVAIAVACGVGFWLRGWHPIWIVVWADLAGTIVIFGFSLAFRNSSFYDAYWSVAPMAIVVFWMLHPAAQGAVWWRQLLVVTLVWLWGTRLTFNWARGWKGLHHQDWRYDRIHERTGVLYWPVSFLGIHLFPTVQVFLGCLGMYAAMVSGQRPFGVLDLLACLVTLAGILIEAISDQQLRRFVLSKPPPDAILETGLWAYSRHPNYFGEILFWCGLWLFGLAAAPFVWWGILGFLSITLMFFFISIPMIDRRMLEKRPHYASHIKRRARLLPWRTLPK